MLVFNAADVENFFHLRYHKNVLAEDAPKFALSVNDVTFKFICATELANDRLADEPEGSADDISALLLQVARTDFWCSWLLDFARYPHAGTRRP